MPDTHDITRDMYGAKAMHLYTRDMPSRVYKCTVLDADTTRQRERREGAKRRQQRGDSKDTSLIL
jgi:hypothetical protein